jgi:hypothetical protein
MRQTNMVQHILERYLIEFTIHGKGSGQFLDIYNYGGVGGDWDKNGNQAISIGSGRDQVILNAATWGYGPTAIAGTSYTQLICH